MAIKRVMHDVYPFIDPKGGLRGSMIGKVPLITGAGGGIGRKVALDAATAGSTLIYITGRSQIRLDETAAAIRATSAYCKVVGIPGDILSKDDVKSIFDKAIPSPNVLINNVGAVVCQATIEDSDPDQWWDGISVNLKSVYLCCAEFIKRIKGNRGWIVNVSTSVSVGPTLGGNSSYSCAKASVNRFTQWLDAECREHGIQAIAVHPGGIADTVMGQNAPPVYRSILYDKVGLASGTILYLATERARFLSGRFVYSNWDMEAVEEIKEQIVSQDLLTVNLRLGDFFEAAIVPPEN